MTRKIFILLIPFLISSCGIETYDAEKAYGHWENGAIDEEVEIVNGQFWKSGHWTYEYSVFLELRPSKKWKEKFFELYKADENLVGQYDSEKKYHQIQAAHWFEKPDWFNPNSEFQIYRGYGGNFYWNEKENTLLIFEIQL